MGASIGSSASDAGEADDPYVSDQGGIALVNALSTFKLLIQVYSTASLTNNPFPDTTNTAAQASTLAQSSSSLTDELPPELRIRIYKEVLRCERPLLLAHKDYREAKRFDVSLLATSKSVYTEASDVFYEINTIRIWHPSELHQALKSNTSCIDFVRHIEFVSMVNDDYLNIHELSGMIKTCLQLPRLKTLTIAYDILRLIRLRVKEYVSHLGLDANIRYVDVGVLRLGDGEFSKVHLKHYGMSKAWQAVQDAGPMGITDVVEDFDFEDPAEDADLWMDHAKQLDLPAWCAVYDYYRHWMSLVDPEGDSDDDDDAEVSDEENLLFAWLEKLERAVHDDEVLDIPSVTVAFPLRNLKLAECGEKMLEWFSRVLEEGQYEFPKTIQLYCKGK